jgi:hypothetical protein
VVVYGASGSAVWRRGTGAQVTVTERALDPTARRQVRFHWPFKGRGIGARSAERMRVHNRRQRAERREHVKLPSLVSTSKEGSGKLKVELIGLPPGPLLRKGAAHHRPLTFVLPTLAERMASDSQTGSNRLSSSASPRSCVFPP